MYWVGRTIDSGTYHDRALDLIKRQIHLGTLRPEEQFPPERKLSETLGISRVTLREALKSLETQGFIVAVRGARGGTFVGSDEAINAIAQKHLLARADYVWRSLEYLRANLILASMLSCDRRTPSDIEMLNSSIRKVANSISGGDLREAQYLFCVGLSEASMNPFLKEATETGLNGIFHPIFVDALAALAADRAQKAAVIVEALRHHDRDAAARATSALIDGIGAYIKALMMGASKATVFERSVNLGRHVVSSASDLVRDPSILIDPNT